MRFRIRLVVAGSVLVWLIPIIARAQGLNDLPEKVFTQCGIASALLVAAVIYLAMTNTKTRDAWEEDRKLMAAAYEKLAISHAKLEGIVLRIQSHEGGDC